MARVSQVTRLVPSTGMTSFGLPVGPTLGSTAQLTVPTLLTSISSAIFANQDCWKVDPVKRAIDEGPMLPNNG